MKGNAFCNNRAEVLVTMIVYIRIVLVWHKNKLYQFSKFLMPQAILFFFLATKALFIYKHYT